jgi:hypothetical protein
MGNLVIFAILPLIILGGLLAGLIASGVLTLKPSSDSGSVLDALLLGPAGVVITSKDEIELKTADGSVMVAILPGSVSDPIIFDYQESDLSGAPSLPAGYLNTGRVFDLSARSADGSSSPVEFQRMLTITVEIGPQDLELAGADFSRFFIQNFHEDSLAWDVLPTTGDPFASTVATQVGRLSRFVLTVGPSKSVSQPALDGTPFADTPVPAQVQTGPVSPTPEINNPKPGPTPSLVPSESPDATPTLSPAPTDKMDPNGNPSGSHTHPGLDTDGYPGAYSRSGSHSIANPNSNSGANSDTGTAANPDVAAHSYSDANPNSSPNYSGANADTNPGADFDSGADSNAAANCNANADRHTPTYRYPPSHTDANPRGVYRGRSDGLPV